MRYVNKHRLSYPLANEIPDDQRGPKKNFLKIIFLISFLGFVALSFFRPPLPPKEEITGEVINNEPIQKPVTQKGTEVPMGGGKGGVDHYVFHYHIITSYCQYCFYYVLPGQYSYDPITDHGKSIDSLFYHDTGSMGRKIITPGGYERT